MDYIANVENSEIDVSGIRTVLVQGDSSYPIIRFVLDPSLTGLSWRVRGTYLDTLIPVLSPEIIPVESESSVILDWSVSSDFTTYFGNMQLVVVGANDSGTVITKALGEVTIQRDYSIGTMAEITLNLFEQLFAQTEGAISTHNSDASAHADKEKTSNKVTSISSASTDVQYPSAKCIYDAIAAQRAEKYTAVWDKVNASCTRANSAAGITTTITNFCHRGTVNASRSNPFDSIYPWSAIGVCNISIDLYRALAAGASIRDCIVSWLGDPDFDYNHVNGVWVYTPEFWYTVQDIGAYRYFTVSPTEQPGYIHSPKRIEGRWYGGTYTLTIDGVSKSCLLPKPGMPGKSIAMSTLYTYAKNFGASVENIYGYSATNVLMIVEFATMDTQTAIGSGVSDLYRQSGYTIKANATASAVVKILTADASAYCLPGAIFDIGSSDGSASVGSFIIASTAPDADPTYTNVTLTTDGTTPASVTVTTAHYWSIHGLSNIANADIGRNSGYVGTNGRCHAYYRGQVSHANIFRYILGAYRQTGTGRIWIANNVTEADAYDALNQSVHHDTGLLLPQGTGGAATGGYIQTLGLHNGLLAPLCTAIGGGSINPVGDYCYAPTLATGDTVLIAGGAAYGGADCGRFFGSWHTSAATSSWDCGAVPVLKSP